MMPRLEDVRQNRCLQIFGDIIHSPNLWHLNRHAVSRAFAIGLFWSLIPVPFQMVFAAGIAILWRANIPLSVSLVWITNPLTIPPVFLATYKLGAMLLGSPQVEAPHDLSMQWFLHSMEIIWKPLFVGSLLAGLCAGLIGYVLIQGLWRWQTVRKYRARRPVSRTDNHQSVSGG